jgi:2-oxoisovalerate dehydrogenase E1 component
MTLWANKALEYLENEYEHSCDLFDLRALAPLNLDRIRESVSKTSRLVVIHESRRNVGFGAELVAQITEKQFFDLEAPPLRIASQNMPVPFAAELEADYRPNTDSILSAMIEWIESH